MANPVPTTLVGVGLAWFMFASWRASPKHPAAVQGAPRDFGAAAPDTAAKVGQRFASRGDDAYGSTRQYDRRTRRADVVGETAKPVASNLTDAAGEFREGMWRSARDTRDSVSDATAGYREGPPRPAHDFLDKVAAGYDTVTAGYDTFAETASSAYETAASRAHDATQSINETASQTASQVRGTMSNAANKITRILREQPLVLAGLGLAVGALLGAVLPTTETEDEVMGPASDALKEKLSDAASETLEKGKAVAERAWQEAHAEAEDQGLLPLERVFNSAFGDLTEGERTSEPSLVPQPQEGSERIPGGG